MFIMFPHNNGSLFYVTIFERRKDMFSENEFYYCYSMKLFKFLRMDRDINFICSGLHEKTMQKFWQFKRTEELNKALKEFSQQHYGSNKQ